MAWSARLGSGGRVRLAKLQFRLIPQQGQERALKHLVEQRDLEKVLELRGKIAWEGDLNEMRRGRGGFC